MSACLFHREVRRKSAAVREKCSKSIRRKPQKKTKEKATGTASFRVARCSRKGGKAVRAEASVVYTVDRKIVKGKSPYFCLTLCPTEDGRLSR